MFRVVDAWRMLLNAADGAYAHNIVVRQTVRPYVPGAVAQSSATALNPTASAGIVCVVFERMNERG